MERLKEGFCSLSKEPSYSPSSSSDSASFGGRSFSADQSGVLVPRVPRQVVSLWTCSKLCAIGFAVGVVVGFTLKQRLKRWATKVLKRIKDD